MLIKQFGIGQTQMSWDLRQNPNVIKPFSVLWKTKPEDLLTSFDGASFQMPPEIAGFGWHRDVPWWHTDQSYTRNNFECVQAWVTALDVAQGDATLAVLEGSHELHAKFKEQFKMVDTDDWHKLTPEELKWYEGEGCKEAYIQCPAGSMVLWDSRTIHFGREAIKGRANRNRLRCIGYVCMTPRRLCTTANLKKRIAAFEDLRTTSHWPHKPKLNPTTPRTWGKTLQPLQSIPKPTLSPLGRRLVGYFK